MASGVVRVTIPETLAARFVVPQLPAFLGAYPNLKVELLPAEEPTALIQNGADLAIHSGDLFDSGLVVNKIAATRVVTVATPEPEYLDQKGDVRSVEDLNNQARRSTRPQIIRAPVSAQPSQRRPPARFRSRGPQPAVVVRQLRQSREPLSHKRGLKPIRSRPLLRR
jgi:DNA-binding transcriptional LysR family regulator